MSTAQSLQLSVEACALALDEDFPHPGDSHDRRHVGNADDDNSEADGGGGVEPFQEAL